MTTLLGHTLGTPNHSLHDALVLFAESGLDGAEIIVLDDYMSGIPESDDGSIAAETKALARNLNLSIGCLTPYMSDINSLDDEVRTRDIDRLAACIGLAESMECPRVRVYGGSLVGDEPQNLIDAKWDRLVDALTSLGELATRSGVILCVENHFSTMTVSAHESVRLMEAVDSPGVGILYDQANLAFTHREGFEEAIDIQSRWIRHVHVKDLEFIDHNDHHRLLATSAVSHIDKDKRIHYSRMIGDGILDWPSIIEQLRSTGYQGSYSLEYEYRWSPEDLPIPEIGFPESTRRFWTYAQIASAT